jgi:hypothetical protein
MKKFNKNIIKLKWRNLRIFFKKTIKKINNPFYFSIKNIKLEYTK